MRSVTVLLVFTVVASGCATLNNWVHNPYDDTVARQLYACRSPSANPDACRERFRTATLFARVRSVSASIDGHDQQSVIFDSGDHSTNGLPPGFTCNIPSPQAKRLAADDRVTLVVGRPDYGMSSFALCSVLEVEEPPFETQTPSKVASAAPPAFTQSGPYDDAAAHELYSLTLITNPTLFAAFTEGHRNVQIFGRLKQFEAPGEDGHTTIVVDSGSQPGVATLAAFTCSLPSPDVARIAVNDRLTLRGDMAVDGFSPSLKNCTLVLDEHPPLASSRPNVATPPPPTLSQSGPFSDPAVSALLACRATDELACRNEHDNRPAQLRGRFLQAVADPNLGPIVVLASPVDGTHFAKIGCEVGRGQASTALAALSSLDLVTARGVLRLPDNQDELLLRNCEVVAHTRVAPTTPSEPTAP